MRSANCLARNLMYVAVVSLVLTMSCIAQKTQETQSAVPPLTADIPGSADRYSVLIMGNLAGQQAVWTAPDGSLHIFYQYNDRGRGPKTTSILKLDAKHVPIAENVNGDDYLKSPVHESYKLESGSARWKSNSEEGEKKLTTSSMYISINGAPAELAILARVALANGGKVNLLPEGEAKTDRLAELNLESSGQKMRVTMYAITGLDFSPTYVWLDHRRTFFALVNRWITVIPEGWEASAKPMQAAQDEAAEGRAAEIASKLAHRTPNGIVFAHVNLFDSQSAEILKDRSVVVVGNRIHGIGPSDQVATPAGAKVINAAGKTLLPGLWDMHAHVDDDDGLLNLAAGVTTVRDLGNDIDSLLARRKRIEEGKEVGTRIILAGIIDGRGPFQGPTKVLVSTEAEARAAVDNYKRLGYAQIKIYSSVKPELVPAIIDEAHKNGLRVSGHIPAEMTAAQCVELGYDEIQHINFLMLNFMPDIKDTNTIARLVEPAKRGADLDLHSPQVQSFVKLLQDHHTVLDLTLNVFEDQYLNRAGQIPLGIQPIASRLPIQVRRGLLTTGLNPPAGMDDTYRRSFAKMMEFARLLYRSGLSIEAGTDSMAGFALHRELELDVQAGIPPSQVLQNATLNAARIMSLDQDLGSIAPGKLADLTLVTGDPVANISDIRKTALVMKDGILYKPEELYSALGVAP